MTSATLRTFELLVRERIRERVEVEVVECVIDEELDPYIYIYKLLSPPLAFYAPLEFVHILEWFTRR